MAESALEPFQKCSNCTGYRPDISAALDVSYQAGVDFAICFPRVRTIVASYIADPRTVDAVTAEILIPIALNEASAVEATMLIAGASTDQAKLGVDRFREGFAFATSSVGGQA